MNFLWTSYELLMNFLWTSYELLMNFLWTYHKLLMNFSQTSHELHINAQSLRTSYFHNIACDNTNIDPKSSFSSNSITRKRGSPADQRLYHLAPVVPSTKTRPPWWPQRLQSSGEMFESNFWIKWNLPILFLLTSGSCAEVNKCLIIKRSRVWVQPPPLARGREKAIFLLLFSLFLWPATVSGLKPVTFCWWGVCLPLRNCHCSREKESGADIGWFGRKLP